MKLLRARLKVFSGSQRLRIALLLLIGVAGYGQDPLRFEAEVQALKQRTAATWNPYRPTVLFTGSSSIRLWEGLEAAFPSVQIVNAGFGGSQASDLRYYLEDLVLDYNPLRVFIYEGDNDLAEGKSASRALRDLKSVVAGIRTRYPGMPIVLIAAKPSISRWKLRAKYRRFNRRLSQWAASDPLLSFADVWGPMLLDSGELNTSLFIEDGLHMNPTGYQIWQQVMAPYISSNP